MRATAENLDHRHGQTRRDSGGVGEILPQRLPRHAGGGMQRRHRHGDHRIAAEARFVGRAVQRDQRRVDALLIGDVAPLQRRGDRPVDLRHRAIDAQAAEGRSAVAQLHRFAAAARGARRGDGAPHGAFGHGHFGLDRGPAARIPDAPRPNRCDGGAGAGHAFISRAHPARMAASVMAGTRINGIAKPRTAGAPPRR